MDNSIMTITEDNIDESFGTFIDNTVGNDGEVTMTEQWIEEEFGDNEELKRQYRILLGFETISEEEIQAKREAENKERIALGILPVPDEYQSDLPTGMEYVEAHSEQYIVPECIPACKELWRKNVYTFMVCDTDDLKEGRAWICIQDIYLSDRNKEILESLKQIPNVTVNTWDTYYDHTAYITVPFVGQTAQDMLLDIARRFEMQDVPEGYAYRMYNPGDPVHEGEILEDGRIYLSDYHYKKHLNFLVQ